MKNTLCEACEVLKASIVDECDDPVESYHLCGNCHKRLHDLALRPVEWYNLAKRHGWFQFHLHDDFYDENGKADQPKKDVVDPDQFPAPALSLVRNDPDLLLDFSITQWNFESQVEAAWALIPKNEVLKSLKTRFWNIKNVGIRSRILEISASALGGYGADFIREVWDEYPESVDLISLSEASAACLSFREGFDRVLMSIDSLDRNQKRDFMFSLAFFKTTKTLAWIEKNIFSPITESWAYLAAASSLDWEKISSWLDSGRPMGLVAIDSLRAFQNLPTPFLKKSQFKLIDPPSKGELKDKLAEYMAKDNTPRVKQRVGWLLEDVSNITKDG